jgi:hypothetical protein
LVDTRYATEPSPCPLDGDVNAIHDECVVTLHVQSRSTTIEMFPVPPAEPKDAVGVVTVGSHLEDGVDDGATLVVAELPQAIVDARRQTIIAVEPKLINACVKRDEHGRGARRTLQL